ncbi:ABC transporter substrate-binding protein [Marinobacter oulmenensis]|uniref:Iron complex transport system substrate-binding protein n=1 Tax=Marinobacter oulmenensis TaxID=643747 RepID=A0A840U6R9_9GAMM|nr:iron-siderophore ABC transporter substrate-binding protein [Marinobacter oulmenensis]MBB5319883.1 iron complex transport system substrate-binding protein [Marinobacter oulmenensis]
MAHPSLTDLSPARFLAALPLLLLCLFPPAALASTAVSHALGTTEVPASPERVMSLFQGATDSAVALGIKPVGIVESWIEKPVYRYLRSSLQEVPLLGLETQPDLERIAWLHPDLILGAQNRHQDIYPLLQRIAPTVIAEDVYDFKAVLRTVALATGKTEKGQCLLNHWRNRVTDFRERIARKLGGRWPQTVAILSFRANHARIYYGGFARTILDELGFQSPEAHRQDTWGIKLTSQESIPTMDAQAIFYFMQDEPAVKRTFDDWTAHPLWQNLEAARNGQVYRVDVVAWNMGAGILAANHMLDDLYRHYGLSNTLPEVQDAC